MFDEAGNCICKKGGNEPCGLTREGLLRKTCKYGSTAANMAVVSGSPKMVLLLDWAIRVSCKTEEVADGPDNAEYGELLAIMGCIRGSEASGVVENAITYEVPDVKDEEISERIYKAKVNGERIYDRVMQLELYEILAAELNSEHAGDYGLLLNILKERCAKNVDFEFAPLEHVFLHYLLGIKLIGYNEVSRRLRTFQEQIIRNIIRECKKWDEESMGEGEKMQMTLFSILDPRGRTIMHSLFHTGDYDRMEIVCDIFIDMFREESSMKGCWWTAKDGAGRTLFHMDAIHNMEYFNLAKWKIISDLVKYPHVDSKVTLLCLEEFTYLRGWCFGKKCIHWMDTFPQTAIYLAVLFNSVTAVERLSLGHAKEGIKDYEYHYYVKH